MKEVLCEFFINYFFEEDETTTEKHQQLKQQQLQQQQLEQQQKRLEVSSPTDLHHLSRMSSLELADDFTQTAKRLKIQPRRELDSDDFLLEDGFFNQDRALGNPELDTAISESNATTVNPDKTGEDEAMDIDTEFENLLPDDCDLNSDDFADFSMSEEEVPSPRNGKNSRESADPIPSSSSKPKSDSFLISDSQFDNIETFRSEVINFENNFSDLEQLSDIELESDSIELNFDLPNFIVGLIEIFDQILWNFLIKSLENSTEESTNVSEICAKNLRWWTIFFVVVEVGIF